MKIIEIEGITYWIGQNAQDNWDCIKRSDINWMWFHLEKFPSSHIIICKNSEDINKIEIETANKLLIENSKYKFKNIGIVYCKIQNLNFGEDIGSVTFKSNRAVTKINY